jgi:hypothetical protein
MKDLSEHAHIPHAPTYWTLKRDNSSMEHNSLKNQDIRISSQYAHLHIMSLLATEFHKIMFCSFREVAFTKCFGSIYCEIYKFEGA